MWPGEDCDLCRGSAPPEFLLPPPPLPPFLSSQMDESVANIFCNDISLHDTEMCNSLLMLDNMHNSSLAFRISNIIVICSALFIVTALLAILAIIRCKHKLTKKNITSHKDNVSNLYHECYRSNNNPPANQALYEDICEVSFAKNQTKFVAPIQSHLKMVPYKKQSLQTNRNQQVKICTASGPYAYNPQNIYQETPIYEELPGERDTDLESENEFHESENEFHESEDDFAEDESSVADDTQSNLHSTAHINASLENNIQAQIFINHNKEPYTKRSHLESGWKRGLLIPDSRRMMCNQYYCKYTSGYVNYDEGKIRLPIVKPLHLNTHRVHPQVFCASTNEYLHQDSSFGSDSGYSNHTHNSYPRSQKVVLSSSEFEHVS